MMLRFTFPRSRAALALAVPTLALALTACVVEPARPPQPAPLVEVVPAGPAPGYHWVRGHYVWRADRWEWIRGHWALN